MSKKLYECSTNEIIREVFGEGKNETYEISHYTENKPKLKKWSEATPEEINKIFEGDQDIGETQIDIVFILLVITGILMVIFLKNILKIW